MLALARCGDYPGPQQKSGQVWFLFDLINRLANAFGFAVLEEVSRRRTAAVLHRIGYNLPGFLLRSRTIPAPREGQR